MRPDLAKLNPELYRISYRRDVSRQELLTVNIPDFEDFIKREMAIDVGISLKDRLDWFTQSGVLGKSFIISGYFYSHEKMKNLIRAAYDQGLWEGRSGKRD